MTEKEFRAILRDIREDFLDGMRRQGFYYGKPSGKLRYDATPYDVNQGLCQGFARAVMEAVPESQYWWLPPEGEDPEDPLKCSHAFVLWRGKYYDAECISGVKDWQQLPFVRNWGKSRAKVLQERKESGGKDCT